VAQKRVERFATSIILSAVILNDRLRWRFGFIHRATTSGLYTSVATESSESTHLPSQPMSLYLVKSPSGTYSGDPGDSPLVEDDGQPHRATLRVVHLALLFATVTVVRCCFNLNRRVFSLSPDEPANLAMARWISGGPPYDMFEAGTWRPGYALLIAPFFWITKDQETIVVCALLVSAVLGGAAAVVLALLAMRCTNLPVVAALFACGAIALLPSSLSASGHLWAEPVVTLTFLCTLASLLRFFDSFDLRWGCAAIAWSVLGFTAHGRLLPLVAVTAVATVAGLLAKQRWRDAVAAALLVSVLTPLSVLLSNRVVAALWTDPSDINSVGGVVGHLRNPAGVLVGGSGQVWYLLVSTAGIFGVGLAVLCRRLLRPCDGLTTTDARVIAVATLPLIALSVMFMSNRGRSDQLIYGRYNDAIVWPLIVIGLAWIVARFRRGVLHCGRSQRLVLFGVAAATIETALVVAIELERRGDGRPTAIAMVSGIAPITGDRPLQILLPTIAGLAAFSLIVVAAKLRNRMLIATLALGGLVLVAAGVRTRGVLANDLTAGGDAVSVQFIDPNVLPPGVNVVFGYVPSQFDSGVSVHDQVFYSHLYQWYLPDHRFRITQTGDYPPNALVFAPLFDPILVQQSATVLWTDSDVDIALWRTVPAP